MSISHSALRTFSVFGTLLFLLMAALLPSMASGAWNDTTDVTITTLLLYDESGRMSDTQRAPDYHDLYVTPPATVTFTNLASFDDTRDDGVNRMLVVKIRTNVSERDWSTTTYTPPYHWEGRPTIQEDITREGPDPELYYVHTVYYVYKWKSGDGWVLEQYAGMGEDAYVYKNGVPGGA